MLNRIALTCRAETAILFFLLLVLPCTASADGVNGYLEYNYGTSKNNSSDVTGSTSTKSTNLTQRYSLEINKSLTSTLNLAMGANAQFNTGDSETNGSTLTDGPTKSHSTSSRISPHIDLGYANGFFGGGASFSRRMEDAKSNGVSTPTTYADSYSTRLTWMPEDFPNLNLIYSSFDRYDENRVTQDTNSTSLTFSSRYKLLRSLELNYSGNHSTTTDRLSSFETDTLTQSLRADYNDIFFKDRVMVNSSYNVSTQRTTATNNGSSSSQLLLTRVIIGPFFYATTALTDLSASTPDFNTAASSNALPANVVISAPTVPTNNRVNLEMQVSFAGKVNIIRVLVSPTFFNSSSRDLTTNLGMKADDYVKIGNVFANNNIKVYTSQNGSLWELWAPTAITFKTVDIVNSATGATTTGPAFELQLQNTAKTATYIKVEILPVGNIILSDGPLQKLTVTSLEAYFQDQTTTIKPGTSRTSNQISGAYNLNLRARLWDVPTVTFDSSFDLNHTKSDTTPFAYRYSLSNGLSLYHVFTPTLSTSGRLSRQDSINPSDNTSDSSSSFSISLAATPLPTLNGTLNYSARQDKSDTTSKTSQSLGMSSSAELYRNINLGFNINGSLSSDNTGKEQQSVISSLGVNLVPHRTVSFNFGASDQENWSSGGDTRADSRTSYNRSIDATITYNPIQAVYLFGSINIVAQSHQKTQTAQSIGGAWSPFRDGALQLNISYREGIQADGTKDTTFTNSAHLTIRPGMFLDIAYLIATSAGVTQKNDVQSLSSTFRASF
jgi:hypothetical protein